MWRWSIFFCIITLAGIIYSIYNRYEESPKSHKKIELYNWLPAREAVLLDKIKLINYATECDLILKISKIDITCEYSPDTEAKMTRKFHVKDVIKGTCSPEVLFYDELYLEENHTIQSRIDSSFEGEYYLFLKKEFITFSDKHEAYIDGSEAYVYNYFLFGENIGEILQKSKISTLSNSISKQQE